MRSKERRGVTRRKATAPKHNQLKPRYHNKSLPSRGILNDSPKIQQYQWFTRLLILTSEQIRGKGKLKLANYYAQLATNNTDKSGGIVI